MASDPIRLSKTMAFLLRHRPDVGNLTPDTGGWVELTALTEAVSKLVRTEVAEEEIRLVVEGAAVRRFEVREDRIRAVKRSRRGVVPPDIAYHAATDAQVERYRNEGEISVPEGRSILLSGDESQAWRAAHRLSGSPTVLYVDTSRARRRGARFARNRRTGLYSTDKLHIADALNLQPGFGEQLSAGGIPVTMGEDGVPRLALIRVTRRSGVTWEVAKGKLEPGETPETAGVREVKEEMGWPSDLEVRCLVGLVRYGFMAPGRLPRLKTIFLYLMDPVGPLPTSFSPAAAEGIGSVKWFTPDAAAKAVTHSSLIPVMRHAVKVVADRYR
jgi:putative RNA 2'-phosphotransferase